MRERGYELPERTPEEAGAIIAEEAMRNDLSLFEYFETDRAGHAQDRPRAMQCLRDLDRALQTVLSRVDLDRLCVLIVSDHGNLEDGSVRTHTMNPAIFAMWGPPWNAADQATILPRSLTDLTPLALRALGVEPGSPTSIS